MVKGLDTFQKYFADYEEQYVLIGGAACDILFESNEVNFRATRDLDMVLIVEALTPEFGEKFWEFIVDGKYRNKATNGSNPQFYRFDKPEGEGKKRSRKSMMISVTRNGSMPCTSLVILMLPTPQTT